MQVLQLVATARIPREAARAFGLGRMVALLKPNGRVRGIVVGDFTRRLIARTLAQQNASVFQGACQPYQFALSSRAIAEAGPAVRRKSEEAKAVMAECAKRADHRASKERVTLARSRAGASRALAQGRAQRMPLPRSSALQPPQRGQPSGSDLTAKALGMLVGGAPKPALRLRTVRRAGWPDKGDTKVVSTASCWPFQSGVAKRVQKATTPAEALGEG